MKKSISLSRIAVTALLGAVLALWSPHLLAKPTKAAKRATLEKMEVFADVFARTRRGYVEDVEDKTLIENALNGALQSLDPHSRYIPPAEHKERTVAAKREYGGLGIEVIIEAGIVKVNHAMPDGPAYKAGIRGGDYITAVEGDKVRGKTLDEAVKGMKGEAGDPVTVTVLSAGQLPRDVTVIREVVRGRVVRHRTEQGLGYVFIDTFNNGSLTKDLEHALTLIKEDLDGSIPGLIIDLRNNRGGLLKQAVDVSSLFLDGGEVLSARGRSADDNTRYNAEAGELFPDMPIVVLINSGSASAAEILAGALQDRGRAIVVGRRSFGKGSVQSVITLPDGGALHLTTQRYYTPSGNSIQGRGIMPDVLVSILPDEGKIRRRFREDSLPNSLLNPNDDDYKESYADINYPPESWPEDRDYQLRQATDILKSSQYKTLIAEQSKKYALP